MTDGGSLPAVDVALIRQTVAAAVQQRRVEGRMLQWVAWETVGSRLSGSTATFDDQRPLLERDTAGMETLAQAVEDVIVQFLLCPALTEAGQPYDLTALSRTRADLAEALARYQGVQGIEFTALLALYEDHLRPFLLWAAEEDGRLERRLREGQRTWSGRLAYTLIVAAPRRLRAVRWRVGAVIGAGRRGR